MSLFPRLARAQPAALRLAVLALALPVWAQESVSFAPDDPRIGYSDYACAHVGPERASFDRELAALWVCRQEEMSPGVRASLLVDASHVRFELEYFSAGFYCGQPDPGALSWEFGLVIDGLRRPTGARNPLYPLSDGKTPWIPLGSDLGPHQITLVWPSGADVDLVRVHLKETRDGSVPTLLEAPARVQPVLTAFGDSITHGLDATHVMNTYAVGLGIRTGWKVVNLGFAGRTTQPTDAWLAAGQSACLDGTSPIPDLLLLEIGSNDFHVLGGVYTKLAKFEQRYREWLEEFRRLAPTTPILCVTPLPRGDECQISSRTLEEYRERIRAIVEARADPNLYLFEGRDLIALPPLPGDPLYDGMLLHPTDLGSQQITERLARFNLARNGSFERRPIVNCAEVDAPEPYLWNDVGTGESVLAAGPGASQVLSLAASGSRTQLVSGLSEGERCSLSASGLTTVAGQPGRVSLEYLDAGGLPLGQPLVLAFGQESWRRLARQATVPAGAIRGRLTASKGAGPGRFLVDEIELTLSEF